MMRKKSNDSLVLIVSTLCAILTLISLQSVQVDGVKFNPVPFDNIPIARINSSSSDHKIGADFSIDYGDETVIKKDNGTKHFNNMQFDKDANRISLELECDSNDICGTNLAPEKTKVYLVDGLFKDEQIAENSIPTLELVDNDCGTQSIEDCANLDFYIPPDILPDNYKIVVDITFEEAEWIFINPVQILG